MCQNSSMGQFTGVSLTLLPPKKIIFNDIDEFCCIKRLSYPYSITIFVFFIVNLKSSRPYSENVYSKIMSQGQKRPQNSSDCSICNLDLKKFRGRPPEPPSSAASLRSTAATVPATSTSFLIFREVDLPLYAFSYLAPLLLVTCKEIPVRDCVRMEIVLLWETEKGEGEDGKGYRDNRGKAGNKSPVVEGPALKIQVSPSGLSTLDKSQYTAWKMFL